MTERPVPWKAGRSWAGREIVERKPRAWAVALGFFGSTSVVGRRRFHVVLGDEHVIAAHLAQMKQYLSRGR